MIHEDSVSRRPTNRIRRVAGLARLVVLPVMLAACAPLAPSSPSPTAFVPPPPRMLKGAPMIDCSHDMLPLRCGFLNVPEDRSVSGGRQLQLLVAIWPASDPTPAADAMFFLAGGPGGAATTSYGYTLTTYAELHKTRDFVYFDQRGTGEYGSVHLFDSMPDLTGSDEASLDAAIKAYAQQAVAKVRTKADPTKYTSWIAAEDLDAVRAAIGYDQINLFGGSYGATMAQVYLAVHPEHVRTVTLTGVSLLDVPLFEHTAVGAQEALDNVLARCAADAKCHAAYPNLRDDFDTARALVASNPITTSVLDSQTGKSVVVDSNVFASAIQDFTTTVELAAGLPRAIHKAAGGDVTAIAQMAADSAQSTTSLVMSWSIRCSEAWAHFDPVAVEQKGGTSYFTSAAALSARRMEAGCSAFPRATLPAIDGQAVHSDKPVLLLVGGSDPADPPENSAAAPTVFPNSVTALFPAGGHCVDTYGCGPALVTQFIQAGSGAKLDVSCFAKAPVPAFDITP
jgi:pimeloyl-ACP methyl ester carboxylesterase